MSMYDHAQTPLGRPRSLAQGVRGRARLLRKDRKVPPELYSELDALECAEPWLQGRTLNNKKGTAQRETLRKEVVSLLLL